MISEILQTLFFAIANIFGDLFIIFNAILIIVVLVFGFIYHATKR